MDAFVTLKGIQTVAVCANLCVWWQSGQPVDFTVRTTQPIQTYFYQVLANTDVIVIAVFQLKFDICRLLL